MIRTGWELVAIGLVMVFGMAAVGARPTAAAEGMPELTAKQASGFARLALKGVNKEYPNKLDHVMGAAGDVRGPRDLHPAFFGCYDWHSSVHGHWMLARLVRRFPDLPEAAEIRSVFADHFGAKALKAEADYFARPESRTFERTYGWAWLLKLAEELNGWDDAAARGWAANLKPLADAVAARYVTFLPKQLYPIRTGVHPNTAFGLALAHDYARSVGDDTLRQLVEDRARAYFGHGRRRPGAVGAGRGRLLLAELPRSRPDAPGPPAGGVPGLVRDASSRGRPGASPASCSPRPRSSTGPTPNSSTSTA